MDIHIFNLFTRVDMPPSALNNIDQGGKNEKNETVHRSGSDPGSGSGS